MTLLSPRFRNVQVLKEVEIGKKVLMQGQSSHQIHLVQQALVDLGFPMPISSKSEHYSPDGIFGKETDTVVKAFQTKAGLKADGKIGPLTIRELDKRIGGFSHRLNLHFRSLTLSNVPFDRILSRTEQVYGQYGIEVVMQSGMSLGLSDDEAKRFSKVKQLCVWDVSGGEFEALHNLGPAVPANEIKVFIVNKFQEKDLLGCGGHAPNKPACAVAKNASQWDVAHEVCHVLLTSTFDPVHTLSLKSLMHESASTFPNVPGMTTRQLTQIRASKFVKKLTDIPTM